MSIAQSGYHSLTAELSDVDSEPFQAFAHDAGASGLEVRDQEAPPMPGVRGPPPGEAIVIAFFDSARKAEDARAGAVDEFPSARLLVEKVEERDWSEEWKALIRSVQVGRLWVGPPWDVKNAPADLVRIVIEPKMAFGTGDHPTTSLCLAAVDEYLAVHPGIRVLDVGTGTGVLAIAAKKLGAGEVVGVDNDELSVTLAQENAQDNQTPDVQLSGKTLNLIGGTFELVLANILANTLIELSADLVSKVRKPGGRLVLAGVLAPQESEVSEAFVKRGLKKLATAQQGEWVRLTFEWS